MNRPAVKATVAALVPFLLIGLGAWYPDAVLAVILAFFAALVFLMLWVMAYGAFGGE